MIRLFTIIVAFVVATACFAVETPHSQILVFHKSGEVNLLFADSIKDISIISNENNILCQQFETIGGRKQVIPVNEIDSVAFGSRNISQLKENVRVLKDNIDLPHISEFDGEAISYKHTTPSNLLPAENELLFYGQITSLFPVGLCARVNSVSRRADSYIVAVEAIDPAEVFERLFYAGDSRENQTITIPVLSSPHNAPRLGFDIDASTDFYSSSASLDVSFDNVVINVNKHYYHVQCTVKPTLEMAFDINSIAQQMTFNKNFIERTFNFAPIACVLVPTIDASLFLTLEAELAFKFHLYRQLSLQYEWTRNNGVNSFTKPVVKTSNNEVNKASIEIVLDGNIFSGVEVKPRFSLIGDLAGAGIKIQAGPKFEASLGYGVLRNLSEEYSPNLYANGILSRSIALKYDTFVYSRNIFTGETTETNIGFNGLNEFFKQDVHLFPEFRQTRAGHPTKNIVVTSTEVSKPITYNLEVGFSIEKDNYSDSPKEPIAISFQEQQLEADNDESVGFRDNFQLPTVADDNHIEYIARPVFKYQDLIIKADHVGISDWNPYHNIFSYKNSGKVNLVAGAFDVRTKKSGDSQVLVGNHFPRSVKSTVFGYDLGGGIELPIDKQESSEKNIFGTWEGEMEGEISNLTFNKDFTGILNNDDFTYEINEPQAGDLLIHFIDPSIYAITFTVTDVTQSTISIKKKGKSDIYTLKKQ